ncbi:MAG: alpha/beta fold hydrolase BchO [Pseudomonadota bacterium]
MTPEQRLELWDWPYRAHSQFIEIDGLRWHLQRCGQGPCLLLLHGTGAANHSWCGVMPSLAQHYDVIAPDLPGHGLSAVPPHQSLSLPGMAQALSCLLARLEVKPLWVAGHSAGAAILAEMCLTRHIKPRALISINGAMLALPGFTGAMFASSARALAAMPGVAGWVASLGRKRRFTAAMLESTGSQVSEDMLKRYRCLTGYAPHIAAAVQMMAQWDLKTLEQRLPLLELPVHLICCDNDKTVRPEQATTLSKLVPDSHLHELAGLGHLGHEEDPERILRVLGGVLGRSLI